MLETNLARSRRQCHHRAMRAWIVVLLVACGSQPPQPVANRAPPPPADAAAPAPPKPRSETDRMMAKMGEFRDAFCKCSDTPCAQRVSDEMSRWAQQQEKHDEAPKMSEADMQQATEISQQMSACMMKAMQGSGSGGP